MTDRARGSRVAGRPQGRPATPFTKAGTTMRIYLTEGFQGDVVRVTADGVTVLDLPAVKTNWSTGLAASAEAALDGPARIVVELPGRALQAEHRLQPRPGHGLLIRVGESGIEFRDAEEPVRFL